MRSSAAKHTLRLAAGPDEDDDVNEARWTLSCVGVVHEVIQYRPRKVVPISIPSSVPKSFTVPTV